MNKILLIISREYLTRVRKKTFLIMSLIGPLLIASVYVVPIWLATRDGDEKTVQVVDDSGLFDQKFESRKNLRFIYNSDRIEETKESFKNSNYDALLYIPDINVEDPTGVTIYSEKGISSITREVIERTIEKVIKDIKLEKAGLDREVLKSLDSNVDIRTINLSDGGEKDSNANISTAIGLFAGLLVYFFTFMYGAQVMRGVIEEKTNRIIEVIISSVKPFQLMMGKIIGIAAVGLTQILIWIVLVTIVINVSSMFLDTGAVAKDTLSNQQGIMSAAPIEQPIKVEANVSDNQKAELFKAISTVNFPLIIGSFVFYFLFGYLMYASLFGAVGAAVDSETDTQQFMLPITIPLILSMIVSGAVIADPHGSLAFWFSMIPLTSPVIMMVRLPFIGFSWELFLSMGLLIAGFVLSTWVAGRIYRVGILMYGKKVSWKELSKWFFYKP
ncbi:ABC transporter permease [Flammeovirgaceae bacterium SG7u.111]|nr:ABC transporter permease [Flammeovirgaceae bacterium SG7u.132]WPO34660.1 ABC transporter permease [Flammeovirgaceae bacterium SG7u.111]